MPTYTVRLFATPEYSLTMPDLATVPPPQAYATDPAITLNQLTDYLQQFQAGMQVQIFATSVADIPVKLQSWAHNYLFPQGGPSKLQPGNPIIDVVVNRSRPSGDPEIWRDSPGYAIHPQSNPYVPGNTSDVTVAPAALGPNPPYWISANLVAYKV